jgi:hypothetical protein
MNIGNDDTLTINHPWFSLCLYDGGGWVRVFGKGLSIVDKRKHHPVYSELNGWRRVFRIGRFGVEFLT